MTPESSTRRGVGHLITRPLRQAVYFWRSCWWLTALSFALIPVTAVGMGGQVWAGGKLIDAVASRRGFDVALPPWLIALPALIVLQMVVGALSEVVSAALTSKVFERTAALISHTATAPHGIAHLEDPAAIAELKDHADSLHDYRGQQAVAATMSIYRMRAMGLSVFVIVAAWSWWVALAVTIMEIATSNVFGRWVGKSVEAWSGDGPHAAAWRRSTYFANWGIKPSFGQEVRLFGLLGWATRRHRECFRTYFEGQRADARPLLVRSYLAALLSLAVYVVAYVVLGMDVWNGVLTAGSAVAVLQAMNSLDFFGNLGDTQRHCVANQEMLTQLDARRRGMGLAGVNGRLIDDDPAPLGARGAAEVRLAGVSFTYPSRTEPIFSGLDLTVPAGQSLAVVGVNGAGKSTLIKVLAGLYPPSAGSVTIDGIDPGVDDVARRRVAVIFQQFARYPDPLVDNVAMALPGDARVREKGAREALHRAAADGVVARVGGMDTVLCAEIPGGTDLSGGQWQRVALARALAAVDAGAGVLVLDEPTAALDVRAEAELFEHFLEVTRGVTTILVSHRLSSVRHADRIVVLDGGRVVEDGSHDELMALGGRYAESFALQASRFAAAGTVDEEVSDEAGIE